MGSVITVGYIWKEKTVVRIAVPNTDEEEKNLFDNARNSNVILIPIKKEEKENLDDFIERLESLAEKLRTTGSLP